MNKFSPFRIPPIETFKLNLEVFCSGHYKITKEVKSKIGEFLVGHGQAMTIREAYSNLIRSQEDSKTMLSAFLNNPLDPETFWNSTIFKEVIRQLYTIPHIVNDSTKINWYSFPYYENDLSSFSDVAVILNTDIDLNYAITTHQSLFRLIFASILSQTDTPDSFLSYHLEKSFNNNTDSYLDFLSLIAGDHSDIIKPRKKFLKEWKKVKPITESQKDIMGINENVNGPETLEKILGEHYELCTSALQKVIPPVLNSDGKYSLGERQKSAIAVWWGVCITRGKVMKQPSLKILSEVVQTEFGTSISETTLSGTNNATANSNYRNQLLNLIK
ncbi:MAG: hypothetical protein ABL895_11755 [Cyclobacteriaceae bacterium]